MIGIRRGLTGTNRDDCVDRPAHAAVSQRRCDPSLPREDVPMGVIQDLYSHSVLLAGYRDDVFYPGSDTERKIPAPRRLNMYSESVG